MYYEIVSRRTVMDKNGNDKDKNEKFLVANIELFSEAETKGLEEYNSENDIVAIKRSVIQEFINTRQNESDEDECIYYGTIEETTISNDGSDKVKKYVFGLWAVSVEDATNIVYNYMKGSIIDFKLVGIKKTKILDVI